MNHDGTGQRVRVALTGHENRPENLRLREIAEKVAETCSSITRRV